MRRLSRCLFPYLDIKIQLLLLTVYSSHVVTLLQRIGI